MHEPVKGERHLIAAYIPCSDLHLVLRATHEGYFCWSGTEEYHNRLIKSGLSTVIYCVSSLQPQIGRKTLMRFCTLEPSTGGTLMVRTRLFSPHKTQRTLV